MTNVVLLEFGVAALLLGAVLGLALSRSRKACGWASVCCVGVTAALLWTVAVRTFSAGPEAEATLFELPSLGAALSVNVDQLSAVFLAIVGTVAFLTTLFSVDSMTSYREDGVAKYYPVLLVFFAGVVGVVTVSDFLFFLVFWELMTLTSFFLVIFERRNPVSQRAGLRYFIITHAATFGMFVAALILWSVAGSFRFAALRGALGQLLDTDWVTAHVVLLLFFLGFATKSGVLPMGDWLPDAYPAAPSGATAAFGGSMTKLGIYGLLRVFLCFLPLSPATRTWGMVIAVAGVLSLFVGTLTALRQDDAKRLMSFHVIGQVGYMLLGIGVGLYFLRSNPVLGLLGLLGGVFHMLNHSLYKSCLFLGAGTIHYRTGERNLSAVGGLGAAMPVTMFCALGAALAISGVPPLNGFASKWLMYVTAVLGGRESPVFLLMAIVAMFISLATLASFLKYVGGAFLGPRTTRQGIREAPATMLLPQIVLAAVCLLFGLVPGLPLRYVHQAVVGLVPGTALPDLAALLGGGPGLSLAAGGLTLAAWAPLAVALGLAVLALFSYFGIQRAGSAPVREVPVWTCGETHDPELVRYPASSFYLPFKHAFEKIYPRLTPPAPRIPARLLRVFDIDTWLYFPLVRALERAAGGVSRTHVGTPQVYLLWIVFGAIVVVGILFAVIR